MPLELEASHLFLIKFKLVNGSLLENMDYFIPKESIQLHFEVYDNTNILSMLNFGSPHDLSLSNKGYVRYFDNFVSLLN